MRNRNTRLSVPGIGSLILSVLLLLCFVPVQAQNITGSITGVVTDAKGAVVVGAHVAATNIATGVVTPTTTNGAGIYSIRFLQIGQYKVTVDATGFSTANYGPFSLEIDQTAKVDIPMTVGAATVSVDVNADMQPILNTESPTLGETFTENTINSIPLNGRDFTQLTVYTPGAVSPGFGSYGGMNSAERSTGADNEVSVNGNRQQSNNFLLDGQEINENINNTLGYNPSPDALEQIRVISSNANAEFGNVNGGTILAVMKSGSNKLHGSVFAFLKNYNLDANSWSNDNADIPKNPYTGTQFGGTLGGPILHDKLFFFVDYLGYRYHKGGTTTASVAPAAFRTGDLSAWGHQLYDTVNLTDGKPTPYAGNQVPITNPVALYLFGNTTAYPLPNHAPNANDPSGIQDNFEGPSGSFQKNDQGDVKVDWHLKSSDVLSFRYSQGYAEDGTTADPLPVQFPSASSYPDHFFSANWTRTFSPTIVNLFTASYGRIRFNSGVSTDPSGIFGLTGNQTVGIPSAAQLTAGFSTQNFAVNTGAYYPTNFGTNPTPEIFIDNIFGYSDYLTWQKGRHTLKFGGEFLRYQQNSFYPGNDGELGQFSYNGLFTTSPYDSNGAPYPFADFLTDRVQDVQIGAVTGRTGQRQWRDGVFAQDDFKVNTRLTLNLGLRWEFDQPIYEVNNKMANLNLQTATIIYAGVDGASRALYDPTYTQFQPRVGFAFQPSSRLVVRGGYGISSYVEGTGANLRLTQNPPFHKDFEEIATNPSHTTDTEGNITSYSSGKFFQAAEGFPTTSIPVTTFYAWPKDFKPSVTQEFSLTTEYELTSTASFQVGYVGIIGHHLTDPFWGNQQPNASSPGPYDNIVGNGGVVKITGTESASNYNGLQAIFRQRYHAGLELTANYTYSKSLTDDIGFYGVTNNGSGQYYQQNAYDMSNEWGPAGTDTRHNLSVTGVYELPFGKGKRFGSGWNYYTNSLLGGWKLSGADVYYSGFPVTVSSPAHYSSTVKAFGGAARPNQLNPLHATHKSISAYYGTDVQPISVTEVIDNVPTTVLYATSCGSDQTTSAAFKNNLTTQPCVYQEQGSASFGALRPGSLRAPSFQNIDMSLAKTFGVWREHQVDFRVDAFNLFNIASYAQPDSGMTDSNFGQITNTVNGNRSLALSLKYKF